MYEGKNGPMSMIGAAYAVSTDGTRIAFWSSGVGPPLVLAHGSMADHTTFARLVPLLEPRFTVHVPDRRGRGFSDDGPTYTIEHEYADIAAVADMIADRSGGPVALYGHSYGATCALGAMLLTSNINRLGLYEPAFHGVFRYPSGLVDRLTALVAQGRAEQAVEEAIRDRAGASTSDLETLRALPSWPTRVAAAATIPRELHVDATLAFDPSRYAAATVPTLLLLGERSPTGQKRIVEAIDAAMADSRIAELKGQGHMAQAMAPELVAHELIQFFGARPERATPLNPQKTYLDWGLRPASAPPTVPPDRRDRD